MKAKLLLGLLLIAAVLISGCVQYGQQTQTTTPPSEQQPPAPPPETPPATTGATKEFTIHEQSFKFDVKTITVNKGDTVKITVINDGGFHNFAVPDFSTRTTQESSPNTQTIEFVADKTGSFPYYCEVDGHRGLGLEGTLVVT